MHILLLYPYFKDESSPGHSMTFKLALRLAERNHFVTVITMNCGYMTNEDSATNRGDEKVHDNNIPDNLHIFTHNSFWKQHKSILSRLLFYAEYTLFVFKSIFNVKNPAVILCSSPPIFHSIPAIFYSWLFRVPVLLEVRDLWPLSLIEMGLLKNRFIIFALKQVEKIIYHKSRRIVCYTNGIYKYISNFNNAKKLDFIHCGVDLVSLNPSDKLPSALFKNYGFNGKKIVLYFGAIGIANNVDFILGAAKLLTNDKDILFLIIGDGIEKESICNKVKTECINNVIILPPVPKINAAKYINVASVCLVTLLDKPVFRGAIPTKLIDYMACAKPVISNVKGEAEDLLNLSGAGVTTEADDVFSFAGEIRRFCYDSVLAGQTGLLGRKFVENNFSIDSYLHKFENAIIKTVNQE